MRACLRPTQFSKGSEDIMVRHSACAPGVRGLFLMAIFLCLTPPALATGTLHVVAQNYTDSPFSFSISRDSFIAVPHKMIDDYGLFISGTNAGIYDSGLPTQLRTVPVQISKWGVATITTHGGFTPTDVYAAPLGQHLTLIQSGSGYSDFSGLDLNDAGVISFVGRVSNTTGPNIAFRRRPGESAGYLPDNGAVSLTSTAIDATDRIHIWSQYSSDPFTRIEAYTDDSQWTNRTAGFADTVDSRPPIGTFAVNPAGQFTFAGTYESGTKAGIYLASGSSFNRVFERPFDEPNHPIDTQVTLSDRGDVLAVMGNTSNAAFLRRILLHTYDGRTIDLETLLPSGKSGGLFKSAAMNYHGDVVIEATDIATNTFEYYRYDGNQLSLLLDGQPARAIDLNYGNDGLIYFIRRNDNSTYTLLQTVPEPAGMVILWVMGRLAAARRRRSEFGQVFCFSR